MAGGLGNSRRSMKSRRAQLSRFFENLPANEVLAGLRVTPRTSFADARPSRGRKREIERGRESPIKIEIENSRVLHCANVKHKFHGKISSLFFTFMSPITFVPFETQPHGGVVREKIQMQSYRRMRTRKKID